jgi:hypothetical protein
MHSTAERRNNNFMRVLTAVPPAGGAVHEKRVETLTLPGTFHIYAHLHTPSTKLTVPAISAVPFVFTANFMRDSADLALHQPILSPPALRRHLVQTAFS